jgi:anthranilate phosphoribosyltransferase
MEFVEALLGAAFDASERPFWAKIHNNLQRLATAHGPRSGVIDICTEKLFEGGALTDEEAQSCFKEILTGQLAEDQIGTLLVLLQPDRVPASTLASFARVTRAHARQVKVLLKDDEVLGDTCGTGSDAVGTFNVSTTIMFILAAADIKIAKHGNRAVTSRCGSADVLEELGVRIDLDEHQVGQCINEIGIGFMFAPAFHESFRNVQLIRRKLADELPISDYRRTVFNVLGPLSNPASVKRQIIGVYAESLVEKFAEALKLLQVERALVPFGWCDAKEVGLDEFSTAGRTKYAELGDGKIVMRELVPEDVGLPRLHEVDAIMGGDKVLNAEILEGIISGRDRGPRADLAMLNAGAGLYLGSKATSIREGIVRARELVDSGAALEKLTRLRELTQKLAAEKSG